jgi:hypothetical protein
MHSPTKWATGSAIGKAPTGNTSIDDLRFQLRNPIEALIPENPPFRQFFTKNPPFHLAFWTSIG